MKRKEMQLKIRKPTQPLISPKIYFGNTLECHEMARNAIIFGNTLECHEIARNAIKSQATSHINKLKNIILETP